MKQDYIKLYDEYTHSSNMSRRDFLDRLVKLAGGTAAALTVLPLLENNYVYAQTVKPDDEDLKIEMTEYPIKKGKMRGYLVRPKKIKGKLPTVIVVHENRGLNAHIEDVTRRIALAGFIAMAPDALSPLGGTPADMDKAREMIGKLDGEETVGNFVSGIEYMQKIKGANGKVGAVGFCWGGRMANMLAVSSPKMRAAVAYYGSQPKSEDVSKIKGAVLLHYAGLDERINAGIPAYEQALKDNKIDYQQFIYEGVNHAFNNDTNAARFNEAAAKLAWQRTIDFLKKKLQ